MTTEATSPTLTEVAAEPDLGEAVRRVLQASAEPLTVSRIRSRLPAALRGISPEELTAYLTRQVAANVLWQFPKYRSPQDRFWDRPMAVHLVALVHEALAEKPLTLAELRRKVPVYAQDQLDAVVQDLRTRGKLFRYPKEGRLGERLGNQAPDPKTYLRPELTATFQRLSQLGFSMADLRSAALEMLHEEEWASLPSQPEAASAAQPAAAPPGIPSPVSGGAAFQAADERA
jgi:hypothetical protein